MHKYLPIGSVVLLTESTKRIMIVGVKQKQFDSDKIWDYSACLYPEGILNPDKLFLFDAKQIERLYFVGFQDGEGLSFLNKLNNLESE
ncbi:MAG: DUF4176 domain-containing protein [Clostridia bacterium]